MELEVVLISLELEDVVVMIVEGTELVGEFAQSFHLYSEDDTGVFDELLVIVVTSGT